MKNNIETPATANTTTNSSEEFDFTLSEMETEIVVEAPTPEVIEKPQKTGRRARIFTDVEKLSEAVRKLLHILLEQGADAMVADPDYKFVTKNLWKKTENVDLAIYELDASDHRDARLIHIVELTYKKRKIDWERIESNISDCPVSFNNTMKKFWKKYSDSLKNSKKSEKAEK